MKTQKEKSGNKKILSKKDQEKENKKLKTELVKEGIEEKDKDEELPPFPLPRKGTQEEESGLSQIEEGEEIEEPEFESIDIEDFCRDFTNIPFEIWHVLKPNVQPLSEKEKKLIGKPLSRLVCKYKLQKFARDELILAVFLGGAILSRLKDSKVEERK